MFDSALGRGDGPRTQFGKAAAISAAIHAAISVALIWMAATHHPDTKQVRDVIFVRAVGTRARPETVTTKPAEAQRRPRPRKHKTVVQPSRPDVPPPVAAVEPTPEATDSSEPSLGDPSDSDPTHTSGAGPMTGADISGPPGGEMPVFEAGKMTAPRMIDGAPIEYPTPALQAHVEGTMIVQCVITTAGSVEQCRTIKPLPYMEDAVLKALTSRRYTPVLVDGSPVAVKYVFQIRMVLPH